MKRSTWIWFAISGLLAIIAGLVVVALLSGIIRPPEGISGPRPKVVVARTPIGAGSIIRADQVTTDEIDQVPSGAFTVPSDAVGCTALRDIPETETVFVQDVECEGEIGEGGDWISELEEELAVALPADDILSQWGAVAVGDHVDVLLTLDVVLETPLYPDEVVRRGETITTMQRDQSMDQVSVLVLQNLEVVRIIQEPTPEGQPAQEGQTTGRRALILKIDPQDAVLLKYLRDLEATIDLALRSPENNILFDIEPVNINYLFLRYGITLPEPLR